MQSYIILFITFFIFCNSFLIDMYSGNNNNLQNESSIYGKVLIDGKGAPYVTILVEGTNIGTTIDSDGNFVLADLPAGKIVLIIQGVGYNSIKKEIELEVNEDLEINFTLEPDIYFMEEVIVSGSRIGILNYLPGSAKILNSTEIKAFSPLSGNEVLRYVAGVNVVEEEGAGLRANVGVRGLDPDRSRNVLMLEDGIPVALAPYGEPEMYYTPSIDRMSGVEILKGSGSILYGPQTIGGVINYITADPPPEKSGFISFSGGQGNYYTGQVEYGNTYGNTGYSVNYLRRQAENLGTATFNLNDVNLKLQFNTSVKSDVMVKLSIYDEESNSTYIGQTQTMYDNRKGDYLRLAPDDNLEIRRYSLGVSHNFRMSEAIQLNTTAFAYTTTRNWKRQDFNREAGSDNLTGVVWGDESIPGGALFMRNTTGNRNRRFEVAGLEPRLRYHFTIGKINNTLDAGTRFLYERAFEQRVNGTSADALSGDLRGEEIRTGYAFSAFAQNKMFLGEKFSFTAGIRTEMLEYERYILRNNFTDVNIRNNTVTSSVIPGIGLNYNFNNAIGIFAGLHRGFAPPRIKDAITIEGKDLQLDAEKSWNYELGTRSKLFRFLNIELTAFYMNFSNQVIPVSESSGGTSAGYINAGQTSHKGIEAEVELDISRIINISDRLFVVFNTIVSESAFSDDRYAVHKISKDGLQDTVFVNIKGNSTPYAPGITATGYLHYNSNGGFGLRIGGQYTGSQYTDILNTGDINYWLQVDENDPEYTYFQATSDGLIGELPSYFVMNVSFWYNMTDNLRFNLDVKNLMDKRYIASRRPQGIRVGLPRILTARFTYRF